MVVTICPLSLPSRGSRYPRISISRKEKLKDETSKKNRETIGSQIKEQDSQHTHPIAEILCVKSIGSVRFYM